METSFSAAPVSLNPVPVRRTTTVAEGSTFARSFRNPAHAAAEDGSTKLPDSLPNSAWAPLISSSLTSTASAARPREPVQRHPAARG